MAVASCPYLLDFTSVVFSDNNNCIAIHGYGSIIVKLYLTKRREWMPSARESNIVAWGCFLDGAYWGDFCKALMYVFDEGMNNHYPTVVQYMISYPPNFIKDCSHIKSNEPLVFRGAWSFWRANEQFGDIFTCKERMIKFKSPTTRTPQSFGCWTFKE